MKWLNFGDLATFVAILAVFSLRMRRNVHLGAFGKDPDISIQFFDLGFLTDSEISAIWRRFQLIFSPEKLKVRHISTSGLFGLLT